MKSHHKPTAGRWGVSWLGTKNALCWVYSDVDNRMIADCGGTLDRPRDEREANAMLVAEAGTVFNETKLTPRMMQESRAAYIEIGIRLINEKAELLEILELLANSCCGEDDKLIEKAHLIIRKLKGGS